MITKHNTPVYQISWLNYAESGTIGTFYEPESLEELTELCRSLYGEGKEFLVIGHTSNIYFLPSYSVDIVVSTRRVREIAIAEDYIEAACGVSVRHLAKSMVEEGIKGFEGLIDLPGTVAASVYGNASSYGCSINDLLISLRVLRPDGKEEVLAPSDLKLSKRSSSFKRGERDGIILSVKLRKEQGDVEGLKAKAEANHAKRMASQPPAQNNLGSIYRDRSELTVVGRIVNYISSLYTVFARFGCKDKKELQKKKMAFNLRLLRAKDLIPYVYNWNRYIWSDKDAHSLFWKFHQRHQVMYKNSDFEIEIKGTK